MRKILLAATIMGASCDCALSATFIRCTSQQKGDIVTITLDKIKKYGHTLNCIAGDFIADMTPCAPNGGYGLSAPTGSASLVGVVMRWQDYGNHLGGVVGSNVDATTISFSGGYMSPGADGSGFHQGWTFTVDRLSADGVLRTFKDEIMETKDSTTKYRCSTATRKL
ncbi:MAG TPA: hypothetical protein VIE66_21820 [Methylocella sp.]|jgi:hypothetical protein